MKAYNINININLRGVAEAPETEENQLARPSLLRKDHEYQEMVGTEGSPVPQHDQPR